MATHGEKLEAVDITLQKTNKWLKEIDKELGWSGRHRALKALRAVLRTLRDRLSVEEASQLGCQLPTLIRGMFYENWNPGHGRKKIRKEEDFVAQVQTYFPRQDSGESHRIIKVVFRILEKHISKGEISDIISTFPRDLKKLWPSAALQEKP